MSGRGVPFIGRHEQEGDNEEGERSSLGHRESSCGRSSDKDTVPRDSSVFCLLFQQVVEKGETSVDVDVLMNFIQKLQLGQKEGEEVYDSSESSSSMTYDLHTLKTMLQCNCDDTNRIEEEKYLHIIKAWVAHVRESKKMPESPKQEVLSVTDSPVSVGHDEMDVSYGSYCHNDSRNSDETSRRSSGRHETEETVARLRYEIKCLTDRNNSLLRQYDGSEEALRDYQNRNEVLQTKLDEAMGNLAKLKELEYVNSDLGKMLSETRSMNDELLHAKERLNREMERIKTDFNHLENTLSTTRIERDQFLEQLKATQATLSQTKEEERGIREELEVKLNESKSQIMLMTNDLEDASSFNAELRATISELEGQLHQLNSEKIFTSTPFRRDNRALSLLEEIEDQIMENRDITAENEEEEDSNAEVSQGEETEEVRHTKHVETQESPELESFKLRVNEKDVKIRSKTSNIIDSISGILSPDVSSSSITTSVVSSTDDQTSIRLKLQGTLKDKVKLKKENKNLKKENSDLINRLQQLEALLRDLQGTNGFGPAHIIPEYVDDEVPEAHSHTDGDLPLDISPSTSSSEVVPKTTDGDYVVKFTQQEYISTTCPHSSQQQHTTARSNIQTSVVYTTAIQGTLSHTTDGLGNQQPPPPPPPTGLNPEFQAQHTGTPQGHNVVYETNILVESQPYPTTTEQSQENVVPLHSVPASTAASHTDPTFKEMSESQVQTSTQSSPLVTTERVPGQEPSVTVAQSMDNGPLLISSTSMTSVSTTNVTSAITQTSQTTSAVPVTDTLVVTVPHSTPLVHTQATSTHSPATSVDVTTVSSLISSPSVYTQTTGMETVTPPVNLPPSTVMAQSHHVDTPYPGHQDLAPRSLQFETESPSFIDSLEDVRENTLEEVYTKPIPSARRRVFSRDPTQQDDSISMESSDLPLRTMQDDRTSRSTSPGRVFVTTKRDSGNDSQPRNITDFDSTLTGQQHKRSRSAEPYLTYKEGDTLRNYSLDTSTLLGKVEPEQRSRRSLVLEEPLQKDIVGVVNIKPGFNEEMEAQEDAEDVSHVFPMVSEEVDAPTVLRQRSVVDEHPETREQATSVDLNRNLESQRSSRCPSLSSFLLNSLLILFITILILAFFILMVISHDAVERCGSYCPHSPVQFLYSTFEPYFQYTKSSTPL